MPKINTVDNFNSKYCDVTSGKNKNESNNFYCCVNSSRIEIPNFCLKNYLSSKNSHYLTFNPLESESNGYDKRNDDDLILSIHKSLDDGKDLVAKSGNYIGQFNYAKHNIQIGSRFGEKFLRRMLNVVNGVFLHEETTTNQTYSADFILYYLFIQKLEKAFLLGLPSVYQIVHHHDLNVRGQVDINHLIKSDIPFKGKISTRQRIREVDHNIVTVLSSALRIIKLKFPSMLQNVHNVYTALRQQNPKVLDTDTIHLATRSRALNNPIYHQYREVLNLAELILKYDGLSPLSSGESNGLGFLVNVAELFELYITKLLQKEFDTWEVSSPKLLVYNNKFYQRNMIPDIVMKKGNAVLVFDTKYKRMKYTSRSKQGIGDLDRADFFQIHSYLSYYQNKADIKLIAGGLIYPLSDEYQFEDCVSNSLFGNKNNTKFIVDGVIVDENKTVDCDFELAEEDFLARIANYTK